MKENCSRSRGIELKYTKRILAALVLIGAFTVLMVVLQMTAGGTEQTDSDTVGTFVNQSVTLSMADLRYGPQSWRPFLPPLGIDPDESRQSEETWYLAFFDLNGTPEGLTMYQDQISPVKVTYQVQNLSGRMTFDVYGWGDSPRRYWTNRQTGFGANGYMVLGGAEPGETVAEAAPLSETRPYQVFVAGRDPTISGLVNLSFDRPWSGLDALHITADPAVRKGQMTNTTAEKGSFHITYTGGNEVDHTLLMVAVDRPQPDSFKLTITSGPVEAL